MNKNKRYTCVVRTYIMDLIEIGELTEDYYHTYTCNSRGTDSSIVLGNDVMEMDYFDNKTQKEALAEYLRLLECMGAEYREVA